MGFTNLYTKSTANPKDIDFATVGTRVKNKIPEAAIKAFLAKVPKPLAKPFDFTFDKDYDTGKLQIAVKQVGFVHGWVDESFANNKSKMISVEVEIDGWKTRVQQSMDALAKHRGEKDRLARKMETLEKAVASDKVEEAMVKEHQATKQELFKLLSDAKAEWPALMQFWNSGPKEGVMGLMKKHGLPVDQIGGEKKEADGSYAQLQQAVKKFQDEYTALGKETEALNKRADDLTTNLFLKTNARRDRQSEQEELEEAIQKRIGEFQGYKNGDFANVGAKALLKEAKEFMGKSGATWTKLSGDAGGLEKEAVRVQGVHERLRMLGGRVVSEYQAFERPGMQRSGNMPKYQQMLKMVYDEYMGEFNTLQETLQGYKAALLKQKPKAEELARKTEKKVVKAQAKVVKAEAKAAKKGR